MWKLKHYLKGSVGTIFIILLLLIFQSYCDLELPGYTSKIVTQGIQQKGIEDAVPERIGEETWEDLALLMSQEEAGKVADCYTPGEDGIYSLNRLTAKERAELAGILTGPECLLVMLSADAGDYAQFSGAGQAQAEEEDAAAQTEADGDDTAAQTQAAVTNTAVWGKAMLSMLEKLPAAMRENMLSGIRENLEKMPESTREQIAVLFVGQEYERLGEELGARQIGYLLGVGARMLLLAFGAMAATIAVSFLASRMASGTARRLRRDVYRKVMSFNSEEFHRFSTASLITRSTNDIQQIQIMLAMGMRMLLYAPILGIGGVVRVLHTNVSISWVIGLAIAMIALLIIVLFAIAMPKFTILQKLIDRLNLVSREQLTGVMVTRAFSAQEHEEERFEQANLDLTRTNLFVNRCMTWMMPAMMLIMNGVSVLIVYTGAHAIDRGAMQVGDMMAFIQYAMQIIMSFLMISMMSIFIPRSNVAAGRVAEVLETTVRMAEPEHPRTIAKENAGTVEFDHVTFTYPDAQEPVLQDITFTASQGQTVAFIGSTGSGKSTLVSLIPRLFDVTEGAVRVDGVDVRELSRKDLRSRIGYVPQKSVLFSGTIADNIRFGRTDAADGEVAEAAEIAQAAEFIGQKADAYQTKIAQGGTNVSGGQRQRLSIARAIAVKPEILILDDSFSALDFKTDAALRKALKDSTENTTVLIVAQRISTILQADLILVLDEGRIVGRGTHQQLMETCDVYRQIAVSQLSQEELAG